VKLVGVVLIVAAFPERGDFYRIDALVIVERTRVESRESQG
jgi:hypothetical protein